MQNLALTLSDFDQARQDEHVEALRAFLRILESQKQAGEDEALACVRQSEESKC